MAALDTTRTTTGSFGLVSRIGAFFAWVVNAVVEWNDTRVTHKTLNGLSDRELDDIGLCRADIDQITGHHR